MRGSSILFFNLSQNLIAILCWFTYFMQIVKVNFSLFWFAELAEQFQVHNTNTTRGSSKNWFSNFGLIEEIMDLSHILLAVQNINSI